MVEVLSVRGRRFCEKLGIDINNIDNDEFIRILRERSKEQCRKYHQNYYEKHADKIKTATQQYRAEHREEISERKKTYAQQDVLCECGCTVKRNNLSTHLKTQLPQHAVEAQNQQHE